MLESKRKANKKWNKLNYVQVKVSVTKDVREEWKAIAEKAGLSLSSYIKLAIKEKNARDNS